MAIVGTYETLDEALKLTDDVLIQGVIQTFKENGSMMRMLPATQLDGPSHQYNVEKTWAPEDGATMYDIGDQLNTTSDDGYEQISFSLKRAQRTQDLDNFVRSTYKNVNDYKANSINTLAKKMVAFIEHSAIYANSNVSNLMVDGLHAQMFRNPQIRGTGDQGGLNVNANGVLKISHLRNILDAMNPDRYGITPFFLMRREVRTRISAAYQEAGLNQGTSFEMISSLNIGAMDIGRPILAFDGVPLVTSSWMKREKNGTGETSGVRELDADGSDSIFVVMPGTVETDGGTGGVQMFFGNRDTGDGGGVDSGPLPVYRDSFDKLEGKDAGRERLISYFNFGHDLPWVLGRIYNINQAPVQV